jgi:hypothetical protein
MSALNSDYSLNPEEPAHQLMLMKPSGWLHGRLAKTLKPSGSTFSTNKKVYPPTLFTRRDAHFQTLDDLFEILRAADRAGENFSYGQVVSAAIGATPAPIVRRSNAVVLPSKTNILLSDIENTPAMTGVESMLDVNAEDIWRHLCASGCVPEFQMHSDVIVHYSASHGADGSLSPRIHAFQLLDRAIALDWLSVLAGELKVEEVSDNGSTRKHGCIDTSVLEKDRALWGSPIASQLPSGDPFPERWFLIRGQNRLVPVPAVDQLQALAQRQQQRARMLGAKGSGPRGASGAGNDNRENVEAREWQTGTGWRQLYSELRALHGAPMWPTVQKYCGKLIRDEGMEAETRAMFIGEVTDFLTKEAPAWGRVERAADVVSQLPDMWEKLCLQHDWQVNPRPERRLFPAPSLTVEAARDQLASHVDMIVDDTIARLGRADRVAVAIAQIRDARAEADRCDEIGREKLEKAALEEAAARAFRKEKSNSASELALKRASGLRRAATTRFKMGEDLRSRALKFGLRFGVLVEGGEPSPDGVTETFIETPQRAAGIWPIAPAVGVGKTQAVVARVGKLVAATGRVLLGPGTNELAGAIEDRLREQYPEGLPYKLATYKGESQADPINLGRTMCPRAEERTALRLAGVEAGLLCGSEKRGWCQYAPRPKRPQDAPPVCQWWTQQDALADADVVLMNVSPMFAEEAPTFMRRREKAITKYDWVQRKTRTIHIAQNDFDFVVLDEPSFERLEEIESENEEAACVLAIDGLRAGDLLLGPSPEIRPGWRPGLGPDDQAEEGGHQALAQILGELAPATDAICGAALTHGTLYGYLTFGELHEALGPIPDFMRKDRAHELANMAYAAIQQPKGLGGAEPVDAWLGGAGRAYGEWNHKMLFIHRLWAAVAQSLDRARNAEASRPTAYVKRVDIAQGPRRIPAISARKVSTIHKTLRTAPVLLLDASYREDIAEPHLGAIPQPTLRLDAPPAPGSCHVTVATGSAFSYSRINDAIKAWQEASAGKKAKRAGLITQLARWAERGAARVIGRSKMGSGADALLIVPLALEEALEDYWAKAGGRPNNLDLAHYGAIRGLDCWREVMWCGVVGRMLAPLQASVDRANLLTGEVDQSPPREFIRDIGRYGSRNADWSWTLKGSHPRLPDPVAEAVRAECDFELDQAVGRLRLAQRPGAGVQIEILTDHPIANLPVDQFVAWADLLVADDPASQLMASTGFQVEKAEGKNVHKFWPAMARVTGVSEFSLRDKARAPAREAEE